MPNRMDVNVPRRLSREEAIRFCECAFRNAANGTDFADLIECLTDDPGWESALVMLDRKRDATLASEGQSDPTHEGGGRG